MSNSTESVSGIDFDPVLAIAGRMKQAKTSTYLYGRALRLQRFTERAPYEKLKKEVDITKGERTRMKKLNNERFRLNRQLAKTTDAKARENLQKQVSDLGDQIKALKSDAELKAQNTRSIQVLDDEMTTANDLLSNFETEIARGGNDALTRDRLRTRIATRDTLTDQRIKALREASWAKLLKVKGYDSQNLVPGFVSAYTDNLGRMLMPTTTHIAAGQI